MYQWQLDDKISFDQAGYGWHGVVTEILDPGDGHIWYTVLLHQCCWRAYQWYMEKPGVQEVTVCERHCYL